ncbi:phosphate-starvation-inducible PsiE family protein [Acidisoma sp. C75]
MADFNTALRRFIGNTLYETFEHLIMLILTLVVVVLIAFATWHLVLATLVLIAAGQLDPANPAVYPAIFGMFFTVLIGLEFKRSFLIVTSSQASIVRIRSIILIGMLATLRKFIILDLKEINVAETIAVASSVLALGIVYWLVRDQDRRTVDESRAASPRAEAPRAEAHREGALRGQAPGAEGLGGPAPHG